jgi:mono/diheme cytochrome c family protein
MNEPMRSRVWICRGIVGLVIALTGANGQSASAQRDAGGFPAPTAALERGRTVYVLSSCHFCHGIDLTGAAMGAADLMHLPLVGRDENGNLIGPIVRSGLPNLQTAMPQYPDYTQQQIADLAAYIHYLRQQGRYRELTSSADLAGGDAQAGPAYFSGAGKCGACHSPSGDLAAIGGKYDPAKLRSRMLRPAPATASAGERASPGLTAHLKLLENYNDAEVRNLLAYLGSLK